MPQLAREKQFLKKYISWVLSSKPIRHTHKKAATDEDLETSHNENIDQINGSSELLEEPNKISN